MCDSEDQHAACLANLCMICAGRSHTFQQKVKKHLKYVNAYKSELFKYYGIDITTDDHSIHPANLCDMCYKRMWNVKRLKPTNKIYDQ